MSAKYYTLTASLPHMPAFEKAQRLPITEQRLRQRLKALDQEGLGQLKAVGDVLRLHSQPVGLTDAQAAEAYRQAHDRATYPMLRDLLEFRMDQLTILAALRRRRREKAPPASDVPWGMGKRVRWIRQHWDRPDLGLGHVYPWLLEARQLLESGQAMALQALLWRLLWDRLTAYQQADPFGLADVFGSVLKWQLLRMWLARDASASARRFEELCEEVTRDRLQPA